MKSTELLGNSPNFQLWFCLATEHCSHTSWNVVYVKNYFAASSQFEQIFLPIINSFDLWARFEAYSNLIPCLVNPGKGGSFSCYRQNSIKSPLSVIFNPFFCHSLLSMYSGSYPMLFGYHVNMDLKTWRYTVIFYLFYVFFSLDLLYFWKLKHGILPAFAEAKPTTTAIKSQERTNKLHLIFLRESEVIENSFYNKLVSLWNTLTDS